MPTSPRASEIGLPTLRALELRELLDALADARGTVRSTPARTPGATRFQAGKASRALAIAASVSSTPAWGSSASTSSVAGSMT